MQELHIPSVEPVDSACLARLALKRMLATKCSQLPVLENGICLGVVSSESILRRLGQEAAKGNHAKGLMKWPVTRFIDEHSPPLYIDPDEELTDFAEKVEERGFALIGNPKKLESIVTSHHLVDFFMRKTEVFLVLREIETAIRYLIRQKIRDEALGDVLASIHSKDGREQPTELEELSFDELRNLIIERWKDFKDIFADRERTDDDLTRIRDIRNAVFHFRIHLFPTQLTQLRNYRNYYLMLANRGVI